MGKGGGGPGGGTRGGERMAGDGDAAGNPFASSGGDVTGATGHRSGGGRGDEHPRGGRP